MDRTKDRKELLPPKEMKKNFWAPFLFYAIYKMHLKKAHFIAGMLGVRMPFSFLEICSQWPGAVFFGAGLLFFCGACLQ